MITNFQRTRRMSKTTTSIVAATVIFRSLIAVLFIIIACSSSRPSKSSTTPLQCPNFLLGIQTVLAFHIKLPVGSKFSSSFTSTHFFPNKLPQTLFSTQLQQIHYITPFADNNIGTSLDYAAGSANTLLTMKVSGSSKRTRVTKSSRLIERNNERLQSAGRPGTKNFMDPNKVFIGNLPYDATESDIYSLFSKHWNISFDSVRERIESVKIIRDWKTGQSKGYGFIQFYEPMMATSAMESINREGEAAGKGLRINGRKVRLDQGKRKESDKDAELKQKKRLQKEIKNKKEILLEDDEGKTIFSMFEDIDGDRISRDYEEEDQVIEPRTKKGNKAKSDNTGLGMSEDDMITFMEKGGLRGVMPLTVENAGFLGMEGLYVDDDDDDFDFEEYYKENGYSDADYGDIDIEDDDEIVYDGVFEEMYNPNEYEGLTAEEEESMQSMNREQRRAAEKRRKKRKLPFKGFGKQT